MIRKTCGGSTGEKTEDRVARERKMSSFLERLHQARDDLDQRREDPWREKLEAAVRGMETIGSAALLDLLRVPATTGNARRLAQTMRSMGFIPLKSRRLMPGGFRDTTIRGWTRPFRESQLPRRDSPESTGAFLSCSSYTSRSQGRKRVHGLP